MLKFLLNTIWIWDLHKFVHFNLLMPSLKFIDFNITHSLLSKEIAPNWETCAVKYSLGTFHLAVWKPQGTVGLWRAFHLEFPTAHCSNYYALSLSLILLEKGAPIRCESMWQCTTAEQAGPGEWQRSWLWRNVGWARFTGRLQRMHLRGATRVLFSHILGRLKNKVTPSNEG